MVQSYNIDNLAHFFLWNVLLVPIVVFNKTIVLYDIFFIFILLVILKYNNFKIYLINKSFFIISTIVFIAVFAVSMRVETYNIKLYLILIEIILLYSWLVIVTDKTIPLKVLFYISLFTVIKGMLLYLFLTGNISQLKSSISMPLLYIFFYFVMTNKVNIFTYLLFFLSFYILETRSALIILTLFLLTKFRAKNYKMYFILFFIAITIIMYFAIDFNRLKTHSSLSNMKRIELLVTASEIVMENKYIPAGFSLWRSHLKDVTVFKSNRKDNISTHNSVMDIALNFGIIPTLILIYYSLKFMFNANHIYNFYLLLSLYILLFLSPFEGFLRLIVLVIFPYIVYTERIKIIEK